MIVVHDEKCEQYGDMGMHLPIKDHHTAPCIFYDISNIVADREGDTHFTNILSGGQTFQVLMPMKAVNELIEKHKSTKPAAREKGDDML